MLALLLALAAAAPPVEQSGDVAIPPRLRSGSISDADYPAAAIRAGEQGPVGIVMRVDEQGSVADCRVSQPSRSAVLDATSCTLARLRFKFTPGRDRSGRPIVANVRQRIIWRLPKDDTESNPMPVFAQGEMRVSLLRDSVGTRCAIETIGTAFEQVRDDACPIPMRVGPEELAGQAAAIMSVTMITPSGAEPEARRPVRGTLLGRIASDVEVGGNGQLLTCRDADVPGPANSLPSVCQALNQPVPIFQPDAAGQVRRGRVQMEIYRLGSPET